MSLTMWINSWLDKKRLKKLKENGRIIEAKIDDIVKEPYVSVIILRAIAKARILNKEYSFRSQIVWSEKDLKFQRGDSVRILIEIDNPKKYYFDPQQEEY